MCEDCSTTGLRGEPTLPPELTLTGECQAAPEIIFSLTPEGRFAYANPAATLLLGRSLEELRRLRLAELTDNGAESEELASGLALGRPFSGRQLTLRGRDGRRVRIEASAMPMAATGTLVIGKDVTGREEQAQQAAAADQELRSLARIKDDFMAMLSHELRTPLTPLRIYLEVLLAGKAGPLTNQQRDFLKICLKRLDDEQTLIGNLLDFSRLRREGGRLCREDIELRQVLDQAADAIGYEAKRQGVTIEMRLSGSLPFKGDREKLCQVFINLLSNAVRFNRRGGSVVVEGAPLPEGGVRVSVTDTGIGISETELERIFEHFYQVDKGLTRQSAGTGIGLSMARHLARLHGGDITVESKLGEDSTFTVILPART